MCRDEARRGSPGDVGFPRVVGSRFTKHRTPLRVVAMADVCAGDGSGCFWVFVCGRQQDMDGDDQVLKSMIPLESMRSF